jgi:eukaryotic translation initiation factor 2C
VLYCKLLLDFIQFIVYSRAGSPEDQGALQKKRRTTGRARDFMVRIDFAAKVNMRAIDDVLRGLPGAQVDRAQDALRVLDIVLRESASSKGYLLVRDNFFHPSLGQLGNLGEGVEAWRGFHSSIRMTKAGLTLNLDTTMTTVIKPIMVEEFLMEKLNLRGGLERMDERGWNKAKSLLKKVKVETIHMRVSRTHTVTGFSPRACKDLT